MACSAFAQNYSTFLRCFRAPLFRKNVPSKSKLISFHGNTMPRILSTRCLSVCAVKSPISSSQGLALKEPLEPYEKRKDRLMLVDGNSLLYRAYYKLVASINHGTTKHGDGSIDCFLILSRALSLIFDIMELYPSHMAVVFDHSGRTFRHTLYPKYKQHRTSVPDVVLETIQVLKAAIEAMALKVIEVPGVEADDVIGTLAVNGVNNGFHVRIVSPDKDFFQILGPSVRLLRLLPRESRLTSFGIEQFTKSYGDLKPSQHIDVMALAGDNTDNIPGVKGIGAVHALRLITQFGSVENLLENLTQVSSNALREALSTSRDQAILSKELITLRSNLPYYILPFKTSDFLLEKPKDGKEKLMQILQSISMVQNGYSVATAASRLSRFWEKY